MPLGLDYESVAENNAPFRVSVKLNVSEKKNEQQYDDYLAISTCLVTEWNVAFQT